MWNLSDEPRVILLVSLHHPSLPPHAAAPPRTAAQERAMGCYDVRARACACETGRGECEAAAGRASVWSSGCGWCAAQV